MAADLNSLHAILKDPTRRKIIALINERGALSYVDILGLLEIEHTGKLNYHLKQLGDLVSKDENGKYLLTEKGKLAVQVMSSFQPAQRQGRLMIFPISRTGLGKLLLVIMVPLFVLSLFPLSQDYLLSSRISLALGVVTILLLVFGLTHLMQNGRSMGSFSSIRQLMAYSALELSFLMLIFLFSVLGGFGHLPLVSLISGWDGNASLIYIAVLPGVLMWLTITLRLSIHNISEILKVPLVATGFLLMFVLIFACVVPLIGAKVGFLEMCPVMIIESLPLIGFLFIGIVIAECAYRFVEWGGRNSH